MQGGSRLLGLPLSVILIRVCTRAVVHQCHTESVRYTFRLSCYSIVECRSSDQRQETHSLDTKGKWLPNLDLTHSMRAPSGPSRSHDADNTLTAVAELILDLEVVFGGACCFGLAHLFVCLSWCGARAAQRQSCPWPERDGSSPAARQCSQAGSATCQCSAGPACEQPHSCLHVGFKTTYIVVTKLLAKFVVHQHSWTTICRPLFLL